MELLCEDIRKSWLNQPLIQICVCVCVWGRMFFFFLVHAYYMIKQFQDVVGMYMCTCIHSCVCACLRVFVYACVWLYLVSEFVCMCVCVSLRPVLVCSLWFSRFPRCGPDARFELRCCRRLMFPSVYCYPQADRGEGKKQKETEPSLTHTHTFNRLHTVSSRQT